MDIDLHKNIKFDILSYIWFKGRIKRLGMWIMTVIALVIAAIIMAIAANVSHKMFDTCMVFMIIPAWILFTAAVRRMHDHGLTGNWLFFLCPVGIGLMYMAHVLELDVTVDPVVARIEKTSSPLGLGWLFAAAAWFFVSSAVMLCLLYICIGKDEDNIFGSSPYKKSVQA